MYHVSLFYSYFFPSIKWILDIMNNFSFLNVRPLFFFFFHLSISHFNYRYSYTSIAGNPNIYFHGHHNRNRERQRTDDRHHSHVIVQVHLWRSQWIEPTNFISLVSNDWSTLDGIRRSDSHYHVPLALHYTRQRGGGGEEEGRKENSLGVSPE